MEHDFGNSPFSKPAELVVRATEKKYPLATPGASFSLNFEVENTGPGHATDVTLTVRECSDLELALSEHFLGEMQPSIIRVQFPARVLTPANATLADVAISWTNLDGTSGHHEAYVGFNGQASGIDWEKLARETPYDLEPVSIEEQLIGRQDILNNLLSYSRSNAMSSAYIFGQKRVGKTSVVRTLQSHIRKEFTENFVVIYLEGGDYTSPIATQAIATLGNRISRRVRSARPDALREIELPRFEDSLAPLTEFLADVRDLAPDLKILIILDEFDELPLDLYKRGEVGDSFFLTLRSIANREGVAFTLVGSEKMEFIFSSQGHHLNKFNPHRIDYFDRERHWHDFADLVRRPVEHWLEITERALNELHAQTAGNPYFTKLICKSLVSLMVENHDSQATQQEVQLATNRALREVASPSFAHFWEDGIFEARERAEDITLTRRRLLLAMAEAYRRDGYGRQATILQEGRRYNLPEEDTVQLLGDFARRQVITHEDGKYRFKIPFFATWLQERGINEIITQVIDQDAVLRQRKTEADAYVRAEEVIDLISKWGTYQGRQITEDQVRAWLRQFGDNTKQRLMFQLLQKLEFYNQARLREKMREAQGIVFRDLVDRSGPRPVIVDRRRRRSEELVSYIDGPGKRGPSYAKLYADENRVASGNVIERTNLAKALATRKGIETLVLIDDFLGTGDSACKYFDQLEAECGDALRGSNISAYFLAVTGFEEAKRRVETHLAGIKLPVSVNLCDPLDDSARCFDGSSQIFPDEIMRNDALNLAQFFGSKLVRNAPLGYGGSQAAVVFEYNSPNNSLPILWSESEGWRPLFKRT